MEPQVDICFNFVTITENYSIYIAKDANLI